MQKVKIGKTKDVYKLDNGNFLLKFKDTVTGGEDGLGDPGGNLVVGSVDGVGSNALKVTTYYFEILKAMGIHTHYVSSNIAENEMIVRPATMFGKGLEFVVRYEATGSFVRRFSDYISDGEKLDELFEVTLKDDAKNDPPATKDIIVALKLMDAKTFDSIEKSTKEICRVVKNDLAKKGLELIDIKIEFGIVDGKVSLIDEISAGNMRVYENRKKLDYLTLSKKILENK